MDMGKVKSVAVGSFYTSLVAKNILIDPYLND